ncbi:MAG TPA: hypothetical protein VHC72_08065 [Bryobacteraceae bacterium]|jgi:hypothetical protein|nr:hypothetical protein [Bryobacteraceae bacterium]
MSPVPISAATRETLTELRNLLLAQHKLLLDRERASYEKTKGPIGGPGAFLGLVMGNPHFAWLKQISTLVVEIDEALARRSTAGQVEAEALVTQARDIMRPREHGTDFQKRYYDAIQESPDIVILQCRIEQLLGI